MDFLLTILDPAVVEGLIKDYQLGVTSKKDVIFFQLDLNGNCRTDKIMKYNPATGHRIKDKICPGRQAIIDLHVRAIIRYLLFNPE